MLARVVALSRVGRELPDLAALARTIGEGLSAQSCRLAVADTWYTWTADDHSENNSEEEIFDVWFAGGPVGRMSLRRGASARLHRANRRLLRHILTLLGPILDGARRGLALEQQLGTALRHADGIAAARRRTVAEMDDERRILERNLHDGIQHHLVTLQLTVGLLEHHLRTNAAAENIRTRLQSLAAQLERTEAGLVATASGILPVILVTDGLVPALKAELGQQELVHLDLPPSVSNRRYPAPVETAAYFACLEGVSNARRHAPTAVVTVTLHDGYRGLSFAVRDNGPGFDVEALTAGGGLAHLDDRIGAVGGTVTISSTPGAGTVLEGMIPV